MQPTFSHHMKILYNYGLVKGSKVGKWAHYSLDEKAVGDFKSFLELVTNNKEDCICNSEGVCTCE